MNYVHIILETNCIYGTYIENTHMLVNSTVICEYIYLTHLVITYMHRTYNELCYNHNLQLKNVTNL